MIVAIKKEGPPRPSFFISELSSATLHASHYPCFFQLLLDQRTNFTIFRMSTQLFLGEDQFIIDGHFKRSAFTRFQLPGADERL